MYRYEKRIWILAWLTSHALWIQIVTLRFNFISKRYQSLIVMPIDFFSKFYYCITELSFGRRKSAWCFRFYLFICETRSRLSQSFPLILRVGRGDGIICNGYMSLNWIVICRGKSTQPVPKFCYIYFFVLNETSPKVLLAHNLGAFYSLED